MFVSVDLLGPKEMVLSTAQNYSQYLVDPFKMFSDFCHVRKYEKKWAKFFSPLEMLPFFQNIVFSTTSQVLKKCSFKFHSNCQKSLWTLIKCTLILFMLDNTRQNRPKSFPHYKGCLFFYKTLCFQQPLRS